MDGEALYMSIQVTQQLREQIIEHCRKTPMSANQIRAVFGLSKFQTWSTIRALDGTLHIVKYESTPKGGKYAVYGIKKATVKN